MLEAFAFLGGIVTSTFDAFAAVLLMVLIPVMGTIFCIIVYNDLKGDGT